MGTGLHTLHSRVESAARRSEAERRAMARLPTALRGKLLPDLIDCRIVDYNDRGARLKLADGVAIPPGTILVVWSTGMAFQLDVRWRSPGQIGVRFSARCDFRRRTPPLFAEAKAVWLESRPRLGRRELRKSAAMLPTSRRYARLPRFL